MKFDPFSPKNRMSTYYYIFSFAMLISVFSAIHLIEKFRPQPFDTQAVEQIKKFCLAKADRDYTITDSLNKITIRCSVKPMQGTTPANQ